MAVPQVGTSSGMSAVQERSLHIADLQVWMDKAYFVNDCFPEFKGEIVSAKFIGEKSGYCYGFLEFRSHKVAKLVLETYNGKQMPKACQHFRLNWSRRKRSLQTTDASQGGNYKLVVAGDLPKDVTAEELQQHFRTYYPSVKDAEVHTSESQGLYGVITFAKEHERDLASIHMASQCFRRTEDGKPHHFFYKDTAAEYQRAAYPSTHPDDAHPSGSKIYIQNLEKDVSEGFLLRKFSPYGEVSKVTIRGCALIQFVDRSSADKALLHMNDDLILQNSLLTLTMRKSNDESVSVASSVEDFKELTELKELTHEDERSISWFRACEEESTEERKQENDESVPVASAVEDLEEPTHGESPKDLKELTHDDEGSVSGFRTCEEECTDEKTDEGKQENDESVPVASSVEKLEELTHGEPPKDLQELTHEDEGLVSGFRTCEEESTDEKITEEGQQEEEVKQVLDSLIREVDEETQAEVEIAKEAGLNMISEGQRRRRKLKKARQKEKKKLLKQTNEGLEASEGQQTNEGLEASEGQQTNEGLEASEGHQLVISWLWELYASLKHYLFGC